MQGRHCADDVAPIALLDVPSGQVPQPSKREVAPAISPYHPCGHIRHINDELAPVMPLYVPIGHVVQNRALVTLL